MFSWGFQMVTIDSMIKIALYTSNISIPINSKPIDTTKHIQTITKSYQSYLYIQQLILSLLHEQDTLSQPTTLSTPK